LLARSVDALAVIQYFIEKAHSVIHFNFRGSWSGVKSSLEVPLAHQKGLKSNSLWRIHPGECVVLTATLNDWEVIQHKKLTGCKIGSVTVRDSPSFLNDVKVAFVNATRSTGSPT